MNPALLCELGQRAFVAFMSEDDWDDCILRALAVPPQAMHLARQCAESDLEQNRPTLGRHVTP